MGSNSGSFRQTSVAKLQHSINCSHTPLFFPHFKNLISLNFWHMSPDQISLLPFLQAQSLRYQHVTKKTCHQKYPIKIHHHFTFDLCISFISTFTSGIIHKSTTSAAVAACIATKPESRPINLTIPTPAAEGRDIGGPKWWIPLGVSKNRGKTPQNGWWKSWKSLFFNGWFGKTHHLRKHPYGQFWYQFVRFLG